MSNFSLLCTDVGLWDTSTKTTWGLLDFCPAVMQFQVHVVTQMQLTVLSQAGAWGDTEKPQQDIAFILIAPSLAIGCELVFGLMAVCAPPAYPFWWMLARSWCCWLMKAPTGHMPMHRWMILWSTQLCLVRDTLALWLMAYIVWMPAVIWTNCRCGSYCNMGAGWFAQRG